MSFRRSTPIEVRVARWPRRIDGIVSVRVRGLSENAGYQCDYRGTREQAIAALDHALRALRSMAGEAAENTAPAGNPPETTEA